MEHFTLPKDGGILLENIPQDILHSYDKIPTDSYADDGKATKALCEAVISRINSFKGPRLFKLCISTGTTTTSLLKMLVEQCAASKVSFKNVELYTTDEYNLEADSRIMSKSSILKEDFLDRTDIRKENFHSLDCSPDVDKVSLELNGYDAAAREMDLLVISFGEEGQVGFNEAGSDECSRTRAVMLSYNSRKKIADNYFGGALDMVPRMAYTIGLGTMLSASEVLMVAWGENKAVTVKKIVEENIDPLCPASYFQKHPNVRMLVDDGAASLLTREVAPWLIGPCRWTRKFSRKAVIWLCQKVGKPILKLSEQDYLRNGLDGLLEKHGPYDKLNIEVFNDLQHTITGWPGGKPDSDDSTRPVASNPFPKKVVVFSPHPDDDVISMGATLIRLVHQGHDVHVAYETSGNVAVHDDVVLQHMDAARKLGFGDRFDEVKGMIAAKKPGDAEPRPLLDIKAAIRRSEACAACRSFGMNDQTNVHFLNLPFYESGGIKKLPSSQADVDIIKDLLRTVQPNQIYMAGDLADPHGTHRVCTEAAMEALRQIRREGVRWALQCTLWLYRGAWMEWDLGQVDMAVPISPAQVIQKRHAIYHHLSQKDIVPFPGEDSREFWQRAEDRTQHTADLYKELGLAEYQAMEVFVKCGIL